MSKQSRWEGKVSSRLLKTTPQEAWSLLEDFYTIHKWLPGIDTCYKVDGVEGLVRYCSTTLPTPPDGGEVVVKWCYEKLLEIDPVRKCLSYEILENNIGFKSYKSTIEVVSVIDGDGCLLQWSFLADPVEGWSYDDLVAYLDYSLGGMADRMDQAKIEFESFNLS